MGAGHVGGLYHDADGPLHRLPAHVKTAALLAFVVAVVATPREAFWAFGAHAILLVGLWAIGRIPPGFVGKRMLIETPFLLFAIALPFVARGPRVEVLGMALSSDGLWAAWNILAKATLGLGATLTLAATTPLPSIIRGLERLRVPRVITSVAAFMIRYLDLLADELHRMKIARLSRGYDPRWLWQARAIAATAGTLFIRAFERGERVYLAMVSRGYAGSMPSLDSGGAGAGEWTRGLAVPVLAASVASGAWLLR
ncbi:MAG TPA: cobalt ECF transporter T component CbiQ [Actinomycetota bacterium]